MKIPKRLAGLLIFSIALLAIQSAFAFYNPQVGRWANRDPIAENGGINLYRFVRNSPPRYVDRFGLTIRFAPGSPGSFVGHWRDCICQLLQSPTGRDLLTRAASPGIDIVIMPHPAGPKAGLPEYDPDDPQIFVPTVPIGRDPKDPLGVGPENSDVPPADEFVPPTLSGCAAVLAHELGHASEDAHDEPGGINVTLYENPVRRELGIEPRRSYHGFPILLW
jgi:hypothetical protein